MSRGGFIPPMVRAWCMHGPSSALSRYSSAFKFPALVLVTTTLAYNMAESSTEFEWFNDVDDEHPIGKGPTTSSTATSSSLRLRLLLLRGHRRVLLTVSDSYVVNLNYHLGQLLQATLLLRLLLRPDATTPGNDPTPMMTMALFKS